MNLDAIFRTPYPERHVLQKEFVESREPVLLKASKTPFNFNYQGKTYKIGPKGKYFDRETAVDLIDLWGEKGQYRGMDIATGMTAQILRTMKKAEREEWAHLKFSDAYLYHADDGYDDEEDESTVEE